MKLKTRIKRELTKAVIGIFLLIAVLIFGKLNDNISDSFQRENSNVLGEISDLYQVQKIVDGDTINVLINNEKVTVRFIGIDTPESVDPRKEVECFGIEASNYLKSILENKRVKLINDPTQGDTDKYARLLRYVYLEDGTFVNKKMIEDGYAFEYTYNIPYQFQDEFRQVENNARSQDKGLWDKCS